MIGRLPTPDEARAFLADTSPDKRARLVDRLLERPEYADYWANKWADLLRPNPYRVGIKAVFNLDAWLRDAFRRTCPTTSSSARSSPPRGSTFQQRRRRRLPRPPRAGRDRARWSASSSSASGSNAPSATTTRSRSWGQDDFYEFAAYFARVGRKGTGLSPPISGGEEIVFTAKAGAVKHPLTGKVLPPKPLFGNGAGGRRPRRRPARGARPTG